MSENERRGKRQKTGENIAKKQIGAGKSQTGVKHDGSCSFVSFFRQKHGNLR